MLGAAAADDRAREKPPLARANEFVRTLLELIRALARHDVEYVIVGGAAVNIHGLAIDDISADDLCGDYPAVRYGPPTGTVYLDILTRLGDTTRYSDIEIETVELEGVPVRVASPRTLVRMKRNTVRPVDQGDARALIEAFGLEDEDAR